MKFTLLQKTAILFFFSFALFTTQITAQKLDMKLLEAMKPRNIGPGGMSGRVTAIDVVTKNPQVMYVGTASGGLWKSESGGVAWEPVFDSVSVLSIGAVAINQNNPDEIWVGTGEGNPRNSVTGGYGLYKSIDGGKTWKSVGLEKTRNIHRIIIDKNDSKTVYVGAIGSSWGEHPERGVFKTTDGGKTWKKILYVNEKTGLADLVVDPSNPNKLLAAMWEHRRKPWTFNSGGPGSGLYITYDGGENWKKLTDKEGLPKGNLGRIGLAIAPSNTKRIYALVEAQKNALYRSDDGGSKWVKINDKPGIGNRPFYYSDIFVDPKNENRVYSVFTYINSSEDGGKSFRRWADSYVQTGIHPDHHAFWVHPDDPNFIIEGNDGGLNITRDRGKNWRFAENIPVAQFYHISVDNEVPYNVYGGMQDNGSWGGPAYVFKSGGIRNSYWQELMFGDGFDVVPDPVDSRYGYGMSQQGFAGRYDRETGHTQFIRPTHPDPDVQLRFNWNAAIAQDPFDNNTIYFGSQYVHKSTNQGNSWKIISEDLTTNDSTKQKQHLSGGITMDATGAENHTTILSIEPSTLEKGLLWVGTDDGVLQITRDGGKNWSVVSTNMKGMPKGAWIPQIRASKYNAGEAYVIVNNYRMFDFKPYLFRTRDYGQTWEQLLNESVTFGYTLSLVQDPVEPKLLFLGTEHGLYVSIDEAKSWTKWTNGFPAVSTMDLAIQPREHDLVMGTFGRAAWVLDDIRPLRALAKEGGSIIKNKINVFDAPDTYMASNQQATGTRFAGNAIYIGQNRSRGAMITYSVFKPEEKKEEKEADKNSAKKKKGKKGKKEVTEDTKPEGKEIGEKKGMMGMKQDSVTLQIYNSDNKLIRTLKQKYEKNGLQRMYWARDEKGIRYPSRQDTGQRGGRRGGPRGGGEPGGTNVLPGTYKLVMTFMEEKDSASIKVLTDPRIEMTNDILKAKYDAFKEMEAQIAVATKAVNALKKSNKLMDGIMASLKDKKGDAYDSLKKVTTSTKESIKVMMDEFFGKENKKQGITRNPDPSVMSYFFTPNFYMGSSLHAPGDTEKQLMKNAKEKLTPWIEKVNKFYEKPWIDYKALVDATDLSPFKEIEKFSLE